MFPLKFNRSTSPLLALAALLPTACTHIGPDELVPSGQTSAQVGSEAGFGDSMQADYLLSMSYGEAAKLASQAMDVPPYYRVAADDIKHPPILDGKALDSFSAQGSPVFLEINYPYAPLIAICGEAVVSRRGVELKSRAAIRRGLSVLEATSDETVIFLNENRMWAEGPHRLREVGGGRGVDSMGGNPLFDVGEEGQFDAPLSAPSPPTPASTDEQVAEATPATVESEAPDVEAAETPPTQKKRRRLFGLFSKKKDQNESNETETEPSKPVYSEAKVPASEATVTAPEILTAEAEPTKAATSKKTSGRGLFHKLLKKPAETPRNTAPTKKIGGTEYLVGPPVPPKP